MAPACRGRQRGAGRMNGQVQVAVLVGVALLSGVSGYLALRMGALRRALRIDRGTTAAILRAAVDGIVTIDEQGLIAGFNPAAERLFGYRSAEVVGRNVSMLMPEPYRSGHDGYLARYLAGGEARVIGIGREVIGQRKDGSTFPMELSVGESLSGRRRLFAGIVRDITERKRAEQRLRDSEAETRAILETAVDGILTIDQGGLILSANPATERLFGWRTEEMIGRNVSFLMPAPWRAAHDGYLERYQATGERRIIGIGREVQGLRKDGSSFPMELSVGEALVGDARIFTGIVRDVSLRKRAEEELRAAKDQAERASLAQSRFLAAASHDLRQPVQALTLFASALAAKITGAPASALLDDMKGSLEALTMLLDALLDVSRLDAGIVVPHETTFSLSTVIDRLAAEFAPLTAHKEIGLRTVPCSAVVRTDPTLLYRILQNFLSNSLRYTSQGRIVLGCRRRGRKLRIEVADSGIGIPDHLHGEIFKEFYQVGNVERDRSKGLGLGLAIVQRLSRLLRCPVTVRSDEGRGSIFAVEVALVGYNKAANVVPLRSAPQEVPVTGRGLVFVIDDEATVLKALRVAIEDWGYTVLTARTALETISMLTARQQPPDLIIADYRLRGICTGAQVVAQLRDMFETRIPGILITGDTAPERLREANDHGLTLLHKPIQPAELHAAIMENLSSRPGGEAASLGA
ncbi:MAG: PAS domain S-box protein [Azospirillum sp.]|nr:PAS domain S-box protein [Azospirillum sp.]